MNDTITKSIHLKSIIDVTDRLSAFNDSIYEVKTQRDSSHRIVKSVILHVESGHAIERTYGYDSLNLLCKEEIVTDNRYSGEANYVYYLERIDYFYDKNGILTSWNRWDLSNAESVLIEKCVFN